MPPMPLQYRRPLGNRDTTSIVGPPARQANRPQTPDRELGTVPTPRR